MSIPSFDKILNILPPFIGNPATSMDHISPYFCSSEEMCTLFNTSAKRKEILEGLLKLRLKLNELDLQGFQWLAGSFVENIETQEARDPNDIDVVTFISGCSTKNITNKTELSNHIKSRHPDLLDKNHIKTVHMVDHFLIDFYTKPELLVSFTRYWYGLFSHRRDLVWKGLLRLNIENDDQALTLLGVNSNGK